MNDSLLRRSGWARVPSVNASPVHPLRFWAVIALIHLLTSLLHAEDWPMLGRDKTRNAVSLEKGAPVAWDVKTGKNIKWKANLGSMTFSAPVVAHGLVWIGTNNEIPRDPTQTNSAGVLMCFRENDGQFLYQYVSPARLRAEDRQAFTGNPSSPMIEGDHLWFVTTRGEVICLDIGPLQRGAGLPREVWKLDMVGELGIVPRFAAMGGGGICSIAASYRDLIYVVTGNGTTFLDFHTTNPLAPALVCLNKNTGQIVWEDTSPGANILFGEWASPIVIEVNGRGQVVAPQGDGWIRSFDALTGELIWKFDINRKDGQWMETRGFFTTPPVFYRNRIYIALGNYVEFGERPGRLVCLDPTQTGDISLELDDGPGQGKPNPRSGALWHFDRILRTMSTVAIQDGLVIAPDFGGYVYCLDAATGQTNWVHDLRAPVYSSPLIADGKVYVGDSDGTLTIFALSKTNRVIAQHPINAWLSSAPIFANGVLYLPAGPTLYAIQERSPSWPQWRGTDRSNASLETGLLKEWPPAGPPLLWRSSGLGESIHSVTVAGGKVYTVGTYEHNEFALALDETSGEKIWATRLGPTLEQNRLMRWLTQRAPTVDGERLYFLTVNGELVCLSSFDGQELWRKSYVTEFGASRPVWGFSDHPFVDGEKLICTTATTNSAVVALNKETGETIWKAKLDGTFAPGYAATVVSEAAGVRQYIAFFSFGLAGFDAADGQLLWRFARPRTQVASTYTPIVAGDLICSPNGYGGGIVGVQLTKAGDTFLAREAYRRPLPLNPFQDSTARVGDSLYLLQAGHPVCIDLKSGTNIWGEEGGPMKVHTAMTCADGHLYLRRPTGMMELFEISPRGSSLKGSFPIPDHEDAIGVTLPVVVGGRLYLRDNDRLHCYDVSADAVQKKRPAPKSVAVSLAVAQLPAEDSPARTPRTGVNRAPDAVFIPTPQDIVEKMLEIAEVQKSDTVVDLGSGDGRFVITAAQVRQARSVGYEIDDRLVTLARQKIASAGLQSLARIEHADVFTVDLKDADVITVFLYPQLMERLIPQFEKLKPGTRIVSHQFEMPGIRPDRELVIPSNEDGEKHRILLWRTPLKKE